MDAMCLFRKLSSGTKFDFSRFGDDARKLRIISEKRYSTNNNLSQDSKLLETVKKENEENIEKQIEENDKFDAKRKISDDDSNEEEEDDDDFKIGRNIILSNKTKKCKKKSKLNSLEKLAAQKEEQINHFRKQHQINIWGSDIPDPISEFEQLCERYEVSPIILKNIKELGYESPTPIQMQAIPIMIHRREVLACAPTGSGKTAAFLIPIINHLKEPLKKGFRAIVVSPTRELAKQIFRECIRLANGTGLKIHFINKASTAIQKFGQKSAKNFDILVTTPNRLIYLLQQEPPVINLRSVEWLIIDESDKLFEAGEDGFRDQLAIIYKACDSINVRRAMFSATFAYDVEQWCKLNLDNVVTVSIGIRNSATDLVKQELIFVGNESGKLIEFRNLIKRGVMPPVLIFVETKERAKELFSELIYDGINVDVIHSERTQLQRDNTVKSFRSGKIWILICTELMGRGIDFKGVNLVINYDFPRSAISYIHRIGRTGRAGRPGHAITFFTEEDRINLRSIAQVMKDSGCDVPDFMLQLKKPSKKIKKQLARKAVKRETISTIPLYDIEKQAKRESKVTCYESFEFIYTSLPNYLKAVNLLKAVELAFLIYF
ncbi:probable ATP-dependent RNA helicase DDX52 [Centruroides sculpturatus]|uniref:probable ATP-dependent RNA helicase DDX52 n=1 Tax=Centruroides sculpturatus TaxID=218467 RepID=UPI000C6D5ABC|nr:probable ATP-dependent RNA helicase DDX52 [Centruroides sculpturatus]